MAGGVAVEMDIFADLILTEGNRIIIAFNSCRTLIRIGHSNQSNINNQWDSFVIVSSFISYCYSKKYLMAYI